MCTQPQVAPKQCKLVCSRPLLQQLLRIWICHMWQHWCLACSSSLFLLLLLLQWGITTICITGRMGVLLLLLSQGLLELLLLEQANLLQQPND